MHGLTNLKISDIGCQCNMFRCNQPSWGITLQKFQKT